MSPLASTNESSDGYEMKRGKTVKQTLTLQTGSPFVFRRHKVVNDVLQLAHTIPVRFTVVCTNATITTSDKQCINYKLLT